MGQLFETIRQLVAKEKYIVGQHASERLDERGIMEWQVIAALDNGKLLLEKPHETESGDRVAINSPRRNGVQGRLVALGAERRREAGYGAFL